MRGFMLAVGTILAIGALLAVAVTVAAAGGRAARRKSVAHQRRWTDKDEDAFWNHVDAGAE